MTEAKSGDTVRIHYTGSLTDGAQFDSSRSREPLEFTLGNGEIIRGLETGIIGMSEGASNTVTVPASDAYGDHDPAKVQKVDKSLMPADVSLEPGLQLGARTQSGQQITFTVVDVAEEEVTVDANHPLAGKDLVFDVELVEIVRAA